MIRELAQIEKEAKLTSFEQGRYIKWKRRESQKSGTSIDVLNLTSSIHNRLRYGEIDTIEELLAYSPNDWLEINQIGRVRAEQILESLAKYYSLSVSQMLQYWDD